MRFIGNREAAVLFGIAILLSILGLPQPQVFAQGTRSVCERAANLPRLTEGKVYRDRVPPKWFDDGK